MANRLEELEPGTPVLIADRRVGEVRGVYAQGDAKIAEFLAIRWDGGDSDVMVATRDVESLEPAGVVLMGDAAAYESSVSFDPQKLPSARRLR